jgi:ABC-type Fe3+/spermidine/putrescine transport system ATPase subunit
VTLDCNGLTLTLAGDGEVGEAVDLALRPESLVLAAAPPAGGTETVSGKVLSAAFQGASVEYEVDVGGATLRVMSPAPAQFAAGAMVWLAITRSGRAVFRRAAP